MKHPDTIRRVAAYLDRVYIENYSQETDDDSVVAGASLSAASQAMRWVIDELTAHDRDGQTLLDQFNAAEQRSAAGRN